MNLQNMPEVKMGIVAVSRDCFPMTLSENRRKAVVAAYKGEIYECPTVVESEVDMQKALKELREAGCNALVVYLGNFGPETAETLLVKYFHGPCMVVAAAEEGDLVQGRGDAYCGMLNASYNLKLRNLKAYIPEYPVGTAAEVADMIEEFVPIARAIVALKNLKVISFGPRPQDFLACNAPIKRLYDLGIEIEENSELDLFEAFKKHEGDPRIEEVAKDMEKELGEGNMKPEILPKLAQYEITLLDWVEAHKGSRKYVTLTTKCWPAFQTQFGFVPCYVNSRLTGRGIPVSCEVDIWGTVSEYIGTVISQDAVTLLDINNTVPASIYDSEIKGKYDYTQKDTFMGFHCGNTTSGKLTSCTMKYQMIMARNLPEEVLATILAAASINTDGESSVIEELVSCGVMASVWQDFITKNPNLNNNQNEIVTTFNRMIELLNMEKQDVFAKGDYNNFWLLQIALKNYKKTSKGFRNKDLNTYFEYNI